jgi:hypothetical protein
VGAVAGGGGGGGGGASRKVSNCCLGSTSVNHNGSKSARPMKKICKANEKTSRPGSSLALSHVGIQQAVLEQSFVTRRGS